MVAVCRASHFNTGKIPPDVDDHGESSLSDRTLLKHTASDVQKLGTMALSSSSQVRYFTVAIVISCCAHLVSLQPPQYNICCGCCFLTDSCSLSLSQPSSNALRVSWSAYSSRSMQCGSVHRELLCRVWSFMTPYCITSENNLLPYFFFLTCTWWNAGTILVQELLLGCWCWVKLILVSDVTSGGHCCAPVRQMEIASQG